MYWIEGHLYHSKWKKSDSKSVGVLWQTKNCNRWRYIKAQKYFFFNVDHFWSFCWIVTIVLLLFTFWFFGGVACRILAPWEGLEPAPQALEGGALTTWLPRKSFRRIMKLFPFCFLRADSTSLPRKFFPSCSSFYLGNFNRRASLKS